MSGSNTVFRRTALEEIGGFATGVITEDMATGMLLQGKFKSVSVGEVLAVGLAPESWLDLLKAERPVVEREHSVRP
ncbi:hypothetical protein BsIDN1_65910 [Bacillus safensis]|uniref:Uncharacterized protein n=1 Tax=Bacillus safensis TaxID=561879 RepID=A0A5S9MIP9_BACIA|nr:hypothetical protein BsIDN1_65910 [Bacillus safensis]